MIELRDTSDREAAIERLRAVEPYAVGNCGAEAMAFGAHVLDIVENGRVVGTVAVEIDDDLAVISAFEAHGRHAAHELELLELALASKGVRSVSFTTRRPGLVRRGLAHGYVMTECTLKKAIHHG